MMAEPSARGEKQSSAGAGKGLAPGDGLALLRTAGQLFVEHWPALAVIAGAGVAAHWYLADLAVRLGRLGAVPGMLGLSLVPFSSLLAVVGMLLVLRRREQSRHVVADLVAAVGSVLIPFLVVYQSTGAMDDDLRNHAYSGVEDDLGREQVAGTIDTTLRIPAATSLTVLAIVAVAILMRAVGGRLVRTERLWSHREDPRRNALQVLVGYCELVWIVLGAYVITYALTNVQTWWDSRAVAHWLQGWWSTLEITLPTLGGVGRWLLGAAETLAWGASTALVVPIGSRSA
ncbi:MAG: hypothetical protein JJE50_12430 [Actinomycetales bacterium]|nr:hypothetical protein [Actinomycetales bacterium]